MAVPDVAGPVVGWRAWRISRAGVLTSVRDSKSEVWHPGRAEAVCGLECKHEAPHPDCSCGFHAFADTATLRKGTRRLRLESLCGGRDRAYGWRDRVAVGTVALTGRIEVHDDPGYRAQYARPVALARLWTDAAAGPFLNAIERYELDVIEDTAWRDQLDLAQLEHEERRRAELERQRLIAAAKATQPTLVWSLMGDAARSGRYVRLPDSDLQPLFATRSEP